MSFKTSPLDFWKYTVLPSINFAAVLRSLNPTPKGNYFAVDCPSCRKHEAFFYPNGLTITCNRKNKCTYKASLLEWVADTSGIPRGKDFVRAVKSVAEDSGISTGELEGLGGSNE